MEIPRWRRRHPRSDIHADKYNTTILYTLLTIRYTISMTLTQAALLTKRGLLLLLLILLFSSGGFFGFNYYRTYQLSKIPPQRQLLRKSLVLCLQSFFHQAASHLLISHTPWILQPEAFRNCLSL